MNLKLLLIFLYLFFLTSAGFSQNLPFEYGGYLEDLISTSKLPSFSERFYDDEIHARLNTKWYPDSKLTGTFEMRMLAFYGTTIENIPGFLDQLKGHYEFTGLDAVLWNEKKSAGFFQVDRLNFDYETGNLEMTAGRQRIAWGTSWVWNPTDLFNPLSPLEFDYEEGPSVDALRAQYYYGPVSKLEIALRPGKTKNGWIGAGQWTTNNWDYDFHFLGGIRNDRLLTGFSWSGSILKAGFRGELILSEKPKPIPEFQNAYLLVSGIPLSDYKHALINGVLSGDYTFPNSFYIHTEILYNNNGKRKYTGLYLSEAAALGMLSPAMWSIYQEFAYDVTPLIRADFFSLFNPNDKSYVLLPSITYSVVTNVDVFVIGLFFHGKPLTEFGDYGTSIYLRGKWSF